MPLGGFVQVRTVSAEQPQPRHRPKARRGKVEVDGQQVEELVWFWCPGCDELHQIRVWSRDGHGTWGYDGNDEHPTVSPSILVQGGSKGRVCHSFIRDGQWEFLSDCTHALAGQTVPMVPLPEYMFSEPYADDADPAFSPGKEKS